MGRSRRMLDDIFVDGPLAQKVVRFKLWTPDGRIHYSSDHSQDGSSLSAARPPRLCAGRPDACRHQPTWTAPTTRPNVRAGAA
jgi:hypothetical protein